MSFFHPDYTVGVGISPTQLMLADFTAGRESHPALKTPLSYQKTPAIASVL